MTLSEGQTQLLWGGAVAAMVLCMFYVDIPHDVTLLGLAFMPAVWTIATAASLGFALLLAFRAWRGMGGVTEWRVVAALWLALFIITQTHEFVLVRALNYVAVILDIATVVLVLARRVRTRVSS
ncbi:MAG: hypothetical protein JSR60_16740 [Proteobacteria bacterium]|nr:hypothetical protein [Pseudomonadota bacterium]